MTRRGSRDEREQARLVRGWCDGRTAAATLAASLAHSDAPDAEFWTGVARMETGELAEGAACLRRWLPAPDAPVMAAYARAMLAYVEAGVVEAMRLLVDEHGDAWPQWCPFDTDRVVHEVADGEPTLLLRLLSGRADTVRLSYAARVHAGRRVLELALDAPHSGLVASRLLLAERLLDGVEPMTGTGGN